MRSSYEIQIEFSAKRSRLGGYMDHSEVVAYGTALKEARLNEQYQADKAARRRVDRILGRY